MRHFSRPDGDGTIEISLPTLATHLEPAETLFVLDLPEGYEQIDDFAP